MKLGSGSIFTRLFALLLGAIIVSHLLFGALLFVLRSEAPRPPPPPPAASAGQPGGPPYKRPPDSMRFLLPLLLQLFTLSIAAWLAARWLARPILQLADAATRLGEDLERPPMDESGPRETRQAARAFNHMQARIRSQVQERSRFLAAISHDLRTPLTRMRLRLAREGGELPREALQADVEEMAQMLHAALDFLRGDATPDPCQRLDIQALLQTLVDNLQEQGVQADLQGSATPCRAHPLALRRALSNLLDNAVRYGGGVTVSLADHPRQLDILVRDHGPGIPEDQLTAVLEPFVRLESSRNRDTGGCGLGLAIARDVALRHGGRLSLRNHPEGGLEARLQLPRSDEPV